MILTYTIENNKYENIRQILKEEFEMSDRLILKLKTNERICLNDSIVKIGNPIHLGDILTIHLDIDEDNSNIVPTKMDLDILYEDEGMLIVNKPPHLAIHPSQLHYDNSLSNGIKYYFDSIGLCRKIRPVNRLDKDTSGIVIFAKNAYIQECFVRQMKRKQFQKQYLAILEGNLEQTSGIIHVPIGRKSDSIIERQIDENGFDAITHYDVLEYLKDATLVLFRLETGRTHQLRVHSKSIGHPILGDTLYGNSSTLINRQALHAFQISFIHPIRKEKMKLRAEIPDDIIYVIQQKR